jgi:hypothetical protein
MSGCLWDEFGVCTAAPVLIPYLVLSLVSQEFTISHALSVSMKMMLLLSVFFPPSTTGISDEAWQLLPAH